MSASNPNIFRQYLTAIAIILPPALFAKDSFYSFYRVEGSSMEPALAHGDVLLVRKADVYPRRQWAQWTSSQIKHNDVHDPLSDEQTVQRDEENQNALRVIALDAQSQRPIGDFITGYTFLKPPTIHQLGSVLVYRAPDAEKYPSSEYRVKRVIGLGGQIVRPADSFHRIERVPAFGLWVEGDNYCRRNQSINVDSSNATAADTVSTPNNEHQSDTDNLQRNRQCGSSIDSHTYGPICKNLVIGVAERVVWPPSRWGLIPRITSPIPRSWWPDF